MSDRLATLLSDGSSDRALIPALEWSLACVTTSIFTFQWADLGRLPHPPRQLADRIRLAWELYPCDVLFIHRDAERESIDSRTQEIRRALAGRQERPAVCVVPVRMQEAWFLFDEGAIRLAAGNPNGRESLDLPVPTHVEEIPDPKTLLHGILRTASGLKGRRAKGFNPDAAVHRLTASIEDWSPLVRLPAFQAMNAGIRDALDQLDRAP